jgi:hypothetical protein
MREFFFLQKTGSQGAQRLLNGLLTDYQLADVGRAGPHGQGNRQAAFAPLTGEGSLPFIRLLRNPICRGERSEASLPLLIGPAEILRSARDDNGKNHYSATR